MSDKIHAPASPKEVILILTPSKGKNIKINAKYNKVIKKGNIEM